MGPPAGRRAARPRTHAGVRILIVEDDQRIHRPLAEHLRRQHHAVDVVEDGLNGYAFAGAGVHDVILLDIMLPGIDGMEVCRRLRSDNATTPILMITSRESTGDKVSALDAGADDYVVKPFDLFELSARIRALCRRPRESQPPVLSHGDLRLHPGNRVFTYSGLPIALTPTEYAILEMLMRSPTQIFSSSMLRDKVAGFDSVAGQETIKTHITNVRRKIQAAGGPRDTIVSVYGAGYRLADAG